MKRGFHLLLFLPILLIVCRKSYAENNWTKTSLNVNFATVVEPSPWGILVGEMDGNLSLNPPPNDGIYTSKDLGKTWEFLGLKGRGVIDIKYFDGKIYATTFYVKDGTLGLFVSYDKGKSWTKIGPSQVPTKVSRDLHTIYLGTENYGLWISNDEGQTWVQKMGNGGDGTKIKAIESSEDITFVSKSNSVYKSSDNGSTWQEVQSLYNKAVTTFVINNNVVFAGSTGGAGLYLSTDKGNTWRQLSSFGNYTVEGISFFNGKYYVGRYNPVKQKNTIYETSDLGNTWVDTEQNFYLPDQILSIGGVYSDPHYLFAVILGKGVYIYQIPKFEISKFPFLEIPWNYLETNELLDNVTSFFDHAYPFLGYSYYSEPEEEKNTTLSFLGIKDTEPTIYYSSHSGIDFGLKYGTLILAPASGYATYYNCKDCGNTIKIDHESGYQTTYMHLQDDSLVIKTGSIWVNKGDIIGKVGMTGRTTGPHLHFEVVKDKDENGNFNDNFPSGRVDPFGWKDERVKDPWETFSWTDTFGNHIGSASSYLWINGSSEISQLVTPNSSPTNYMNLDNKNVVFSNIVDYFTTKLYSHIQPIINTSLPNLRYIKATSFVLESFDQIGNEITGFSENIQLNINLSVSSLKNINQDSLKIYFWNEISKLWEELPSYFNPVNYNITATTSHLSWFAVFGEKLDNISPLTQIKITGSQVNGWYTNYPMIEFNSFDNEGNIDNTFYSTNFGDTWENYTVPFYLQNDGITTIIFKSQDENGNMEDNNYHVIQVNLLRKNIDKAIVKNVSFSSY